MVLKTWAQCVKYTLQNRPTWYNPNTNTGKSAFYACQNFSNVVGTTFPVNQIDRAVIHRLKAAENKRGVETSTTNRTISAISTVLNFCKDCGLLDFIPPKINDLKEKEAEQQVKVYTMPEVSKISEFCRNTWRKPDLADLIIAGAWTGARQCELLNMKVGDVQWHRNVILVGGRSDFQTKGHTVAEIPIIGDSPLISILQERTRDLPSFEYVFGNDWKSRHQVRYHWGKMIEFCMPEKTYPIKQLRHSFCTALIELGVPLPVVQKLANHKSFTTTLKYARATDEAKRDALSKLTNAYGSMMSVQQKPLPDFSLSELSLAVEA